MTNIVSTMPHFAGFGISDSKGIAITPDFTPGFVEVGGRIPNEKDIIEAVKKLV